MLDGQQHDAVVIGGGVSGAYAAWRLKTGVVSSTSPIPTDPSQRRIALVELSDRIGGRLESLLPPQIENLRAEFGGMAYTELDTLVNAVVAALGLTPTPFTHGSPSNIFYLRGQRFTVAQAREPTFTPPYDIPAADLGVDPRTLISQTIQKVFPGSDKWTWEKWKQATSKGYNGRDFNDLGFWNFLEQNMTNEEFEYARDSTGHTFEVANWNCAQALPWFMVDGQASVYSTLEGGYDQLPITLASTFGTAGGATFMSTQVVSVEPGGQGGAAFEVVAADGSTCTANAVVLAMPRRALELLACPILATSTVRALIASVTGQPVLKIFCCYHETWWSSLSITGGSSGTDLPIGQAWYWGPDSTSNDNSLLLASYCDTLDATYWEGLSNGPRFQTTGPASPDPHWAAQAPSADMVAEVQRQLALFHGMAVPEPYSAAWMDWSGDPYGGAYNSWNVGVRPDQVAAQILQPDATQPLYVCGEAYSFDQGWVEGALDTAEQVVEKLGVDPPTFT
jgi:monoamine oxidase